MHLGLTLAESGDETSDGGRVVQAERVHGVLVRCGGQQAVLVDDLLAEVCVDLPRETLCFKNLLINLKPFKPSIESGINLI